MNIHSSTYVTMQGSFQIAGMRFKNVALKYGIKRFPYHWGSLEPLVGSQLSGVFLHAEGSSFNLHLKGSQVVKPKRTWLETVGNHCQSELTTLDKRTWTT